MRFADQGLKLCYGWPHKPALTGEFFRGRLRPIFARGVSPPPSSKPAPGSPADVRRLYSGGCLDG